MSSRFELRTDKRWILDGTLTTALVALGLVALFTYRGDAAIDYREPDAIGVLLTIGFTVPLLLRRRAPVLMALALAAVNLAFLRWDYPIPTAIVVVLIAIYSLGAYAEFRGGLAGVAAMLGSSYVYMAVTTRRFPDAEDVDLVTAFFLTLGVIGVWAIGRSVRSRRRYTTELEERAERLERTREAEVRAALAEERSRIARELHDVVAHHVSVMTVQAAGARRTLDRDPERSKQAMEAIERTGRGALAEMRRIVGVLRGPDSETPLVLPGRTPQPGLVDVAGLAEHLTGTGLPVDLRIEGTAVPLPVGVELTAYRVIQEALTNTLQHAGPATAQVHLRYSPSELVVEILDDGHGPAVAPPIRNADGARPGHGLLGMRERVALYGGSLTVGPGPAGGFRVQARIPIDDAP